MGIMAESPLYDRIPCPQDVYGREMESRTFTYEEEDEDARELEQHRIDREVEEYQLGRCGEEWEAAIDAFLKRSERDA